MPQTLEYLNNQEASEYKSPENQPEKPKSLELQASHYQEAINSSTEQLKNNRNSTESVIKSINPDSGFNEQEVEQLKSIEAQAQSAAEEFNRKLKEMNIEVTGPLLRQATERRQQKHLAENREANEKTRGDLLRQINELREEDNLPPLGPEEMDNYILGKKPTR